MSSSGSSPCVWCVSQNMRDSLVLNSTSLRGNLHIWVSTATWWGVSRAGHTAPLFGCGTPSTPVFVVCVASLSVVRPLDCWSDPMAGVEPTLWGSGASRRRQSVPDDLHISQSCPGDSEQMWILQGDQAPALPPSTRRMPHVPKATVLTAAATPTMKCGRLGCRLCPCNSRRR